MPKTVVKIDLKESPYKNELIHNRWHPDIPIIEWVKPGEDFVMETYDWTGGFIKNNDSADDVRDIDLSIVHFLSGPIGVHGAEPRAGRRDQPYFESFQTKLPSPLPSRPTPASRGSV